MRQHEAEHSYQMRPGARVNLVAMLREQAS
jgi:hypothetical protein